MRQDHKIFGIGLGKTGTTSLAEAMAALGYKAKHSPKFLNEIEEFDFLNDVFISVRYAFLDHMFPNAKFILTYRELESWIASCEVYSKKKSGRGPLRRLENRFYAYGITWYDKDKFVDAYHRFHKKVFAHFDGRDNFLVMDISKGDGWETLCPFLGKEVPDMPFPHKNKGQYSG